MSDHAFVLFTIIAVSIMIVVLLVSHVDWKQLRREAEELERRRRQHFGDR